MTDPGSGIFDFVNGVFDASKSNDAGWTMTTSTAPASAPEIDASSAGAALALLIGGLTVLRSGRSRKLLASR